MRVAINGFGRIGRLVLRRILSIKSPLEVVAVNDLVPPDNLVYLLKHDSTQGLFSEKMELNVDVLKVKGSSIKFLQ
ncbi:MAG: glyceraldehyde 3-phosphate dehydrogenase NAD-binding domain-containing protein [Victivallaceae bacterium]